MTQEAPQLYFDSNDVFQLDGSPELWEKVDHLVAERKRGFREAVLELTELDSGEELLVLRITNTVKNETTDYPLLVRGALDEGTEQAYVDWMIDNQIITREEYDDCLVQITESEEDDTSQEINLEAEIKDPEIARIQDLMDAGVFIFDEEGVDNPVTAQNFLSWLGEQLRVHSQKTFTSEGVDPETGTPWLQIGIEGVKKNEQTRYEPVVSFMPYSLDDCIEAVLDGREQEFLNYYREKFRTALEILKTHQVLTDRSAGALYEKYRELPGQVMALARYLGAYTEFAPWMKDTMPVGEMNPYQYAGKLLDDRLRLLNSGETESQASWGDNKSDDRTGFSLTVTGRKNGSGQPQLTLIDADIDERTDVKASVNSIQFALAFLRETGFISAAEENTASAGLDRLPPLVKLFSRMQQIVRPLPEAAVISGQGKLMRTGSVVFSGFENYLFSVSVAPEGKRHRQQLYFTKLPYAMWQSLPSRFRLAELVAGVSGRAAEVGAVISDGTTDTPLTPYLVRIRESELALAIAVPDASLRRWISQGLNQVSLETQLEQAMGAVIREIYSKWLLKETDDWMREKNFPRPKNRSAVKISDKSRRQPPPSRSSRLDQIIDQTGKAAGQVLSGLKKKK